MQHSRCNTTDATQQMQHSECNTASATQQQHYQQPCLEQQDLKQPCKQQCLKQQGNTTIHELPGTTPDIPEVDFRSAFAADMCIRDEFQPCQLAAAFGVDIMESCMYPGLGLGLGLCPGGLGRFDLT